MILNVQASAIKLSATLGLVFMRLGVQHKARLKSFINETLENDLLLPMVYLRKLSKKLINIAGQKLKQDLFLLLLVLKCVICICCIWIWAIGLSELDLILLSRKFCKHSKA